MAKDKSPSRTAPAARAKKAPGVTAAEVAASSGEPARYTWVELKKRIGEPSAEELEVYAVHVPDEELVKAGATVKSQRLLTDGRRWLGQLWPYWSKLSADDKQNILGFSDARLRVTLAHFLALDSAIRSNESAPNVAIDHARVVAEADARYRKGQREREAFAAALRGAVTSDASIAAQLAAANTPATNASDLAATLRNLAALALAAVGPTSNAARALRADGFTDARIEALSTLAGELDRDASRGGAGGARPVSQAEIDRLDGVCIAHMQHIRSVFRTAKKSDPRVPTLQAIATRSVFWTGRRAKAAAATDKGAAKPT
jgi:hypothetical protein